MPYITFTELLLTTHNVVLFKLIYGQGMVDYKHDLIITPKERPGLETP